jgi:hypothetical protein
MQNSIQTLNNKVRSVHEETKGNQSQVETSKTYCLWLEAAQYRSNVDIQNSIFAYLSGNEIVHTISLLSKKMRACLRTPKQQENFRERKQIVVSPARFFIGAGIDWLVKLRNGSKLDNPAKREVVTAF